MRLKSGKAADSFWPANEIAAATKTRARGAILLAKLDGSLQPGKSCC
jgi:hypothetical protein